MANQLPSAQARARRQGATLLTFPSLSTATLQDFSHKRLAIFIHGFTADSSYMRDLMHQFDGAGYRALAFEYPSDRGIDYGAKELRDLLSRYDVNQDLSKNRAVLVGHSMGGLVARTFVAFEGGGTYVRKVITLGSPNDGTLKNSLLLRLLLDWGESVSGLNPHAYSPHSVSAKQLLQRDSPKLLDQLNRSKLTNGYVAFYSVSGAKATIDFGKSVAKNYIANRYLQKKLSSPNDGLVQETSSDLSGERFRISAPGCRHTNVYTDYPHTNHTFLVNNQTVAVETLLCAK